MIGVGRDVLPTLWHEFLGHVSKDGSLETELAQARQVAINKGVQAGPVLVGLMVLAVCGFLLVVEGGSGLLVVFCSFAVGLTVMCFRGAFLVPGEARSRKPINGCSMSPWDWA